MVSAAVARAVARFVTAIRVRGDRRAPRATWPHGRVGLAGWQWFLPRPSAVGLGVVLFYLPDRPEGAAAADGWLWSASQPRELAGQRHDFSVVRTLWWVVWR
jgi:hypothetical protein